LSISEIEVQDLLSEQSDDLRAVIASNRKRKMDNQDDELRRTKDALRKVEDEMVKMREELELMRGGRPQGGGHALGFVPSTFMALNFMVALSWVADTIAQEMKKEMVKYPNYFENAKAGMNTGAGKMGFKSCLKFNRGEACGSEWHIQSRPKKNGSGYRKELRLHCCALCKEALDVIACHSLMACPWLSMEKWEMVKEEEDKLINSMK
jgi:hypothetical protein